MTRDPFACYERNVHVETSKRFYPAKIPNVHNQLRHLICSPSANHIFYVDARDVWCLDPASKRRTHITELTFDPSCTGSGHGWFCAGGLHAGHFVCIYIPHSTDSTGTARLNNIFGSYSRPESSSSVFLVDYIQLGSAITNSVSIHRISQSDSEQDDDIVAVVTNNDCTVRVFSLLTKTELTRLEFEYAMNHASISPDGTLMMIVGDQETGFVYHRTPTTKLDADGQLRITGSQWTLLRDMDLYKPPEAKQSGYFTTAWSASGALCATASELGYATVIDTNMLRDLDVNPIAAIVPSSRPRTTPGAIRSICFAPDQFDLLMWTENMGRMCVADLRSGLRARQVVTLDATAEGVVKIDALKVTRSAIDPELRDFDFDIGIIRRQHSGYNYPQLTAELERQNRARPNARPDPTERDISFASEYLAASAERRRLQRANGVPDLDDDINGLTEQERQVIDGIRTSRQHEARYLESRRQGSEAEAASSDLSRRPSPQSINYSSPGRRRRHWDSLLDATEELGREHTTLSSIRDYLWASRLDSDGRADALSALAQHRIRSRIEASPSASSSRPSSSSNLANTNNSAGSSTDPWRTIEAAMRATAPWASTNPASTSGASRERNQETVDSDNDSTTNLRSAPVSGPSQSSSSRTTSTRVTLPSTLRGSSSAFLDGERRRLQGETSNSGNELTTRGQVMYARQRERERLAYGDATDDARPQDSSGGLPRFEPGVLRRMAAGTRSTMIEPQYFGPEATIRRNMPTSIDGVDDSNDPEDTWGVGTAGICFGNNGRVVYVGTEEGIFELKVNLRERQFWPAITPR